jgi:hypothetical protein
LTGRGSPVKRINDYWLQGVLWFDNFLDAPSRRPREIVVTLLIVLLIAAALLSRWSS